MKIESVGAFYDARVSYFRPWVIARALIERSALLFSDLLTVAIALYLWLDLSALARFAGQPPMLSVWMQDATPSHFISFFSAATLVLFWFLNEGHYSRRLPFWEEHGRVLKIMLTGFVSEIALLILLSHAPIDWIAVGGTWLCLLLILPVGRFLTRRTLLKCGLWKRNVIIVGLGENARSAHAALRGEPMMGFEVKWFGRSPYDAPFPDDSLEVTGARIPVVDLTRNAHLTLAGLDHPKIVVAFDKVVEQEGFILQLGTTNNDVLIAPPLRGLPLHGAEVSHFFSRELLMLRVRNNLARRSCRMTKYLFDFSVAAVLLIALSPVFIAITILIRRDGGNALYGHARIGANGQAFGCLKFRSMVVDADHRLKDLLDRDPIARAEWDKDFKLKSDPRITAIGAFLRRSSLDELPQLLNVLRGEMSLVGPRPVVREELQRYREQVGYYLQVRPGITGLWQVSGRNDVDYATRVGLDAWYVKNWSLWTDVVILLKTFRVVLGRIGAY
jgi:undecaprenyl-phosphate galactose phosphotransferase